MPGRLFFFFWFELAFWSVVAHVATPAHCDEPTPEQVQFFEKKIRPILNDHCFECHSAEKQESDLRLDSRDSILSGGASGAAVDLEDPESSMILEVLRYGGDVEMPPNQKLDDEVIDDIQSWISMGLPWPGKKGDDPDDLPRNMQERVGLHRASHWAFLEITRPDFSSAPLRPWIRNSLDRLILEKLDRSGIAPSEEADRATLTRRLYLALVGIPPSYEEVSEVLNDPSPAWYTRLVDRLQSSPRYGERWARHWLDVARYADTRGYSFQRDRNYPHAYTYRDYVIRSFNEDKPYRRFLTEQLAADQLELGEDLRPLAALGFLTVGRKFNNVHDDVDDKIDVVFRGLQGLTVACARCHDHKYDAIPTADYYSLYGVFVSGQEGSLPYIGQRKEVEAFQQQKSRFDAEEKKFRDYVRKKRNEISDHARSHTAAYLVRVLNAGRSREWEGVDFVTLDPSSLVARIESAWARYILKQARQNHPVWAAWSRLSALEDDEEFERLSAAEIEKLKSENLLNPLVLAELTGNPPRKRVEIARVYGKVFSDVYQAWKKAGSNDQGLDRLSQDQQQVGIALFTDRTPTDIREDAVRGYLTGESLDAFQQLKTGVEQMKKSLPPELDRAMVVSDIAKPVEPFVFIRGQIGRRGKDVPRQFLEVLSPEPRKVFVKGAGRLEIAQAMTRRSNPLTARVMANRVWMHLMGESIVPTPSDFGTRCSKPVQGDVLDLLASRLVDSDWSIKELQRMIVCSSVFRQSSHYREEAAAKDATNGLYWRANRQRIEFETLRDSMLAVSGELDLRMGGPAVRMNGKSPSRRRAVYGFIDRQDLPNLLRAFDFASPDQSIARRAKTTVPQQLLFMMNSSFVTGRALEVARSIPGNLAARQKIATLYQKVLSRDPTDGEIRVAEGFFEAAEGDPKVLGSLAQILLLTNEFTFAD